MLDFMTVYNEYNKYKDFTIKAFAYLNGKINPNNLCIAKLDYYDKYNFAEFRKPNLICIKLGSIIDQLYYEPDELKKSLIFLSVAHELVHANQSASMLRYSMDSLYAKAIESHAQYTAQEFLKARRLEILDIFGVDVQLGISYYGEIKEIPHDVPFNIEMYYINTLVDMIMGNKMDHTVRLQKIFQIPTIRIIFDDKIVLIKKDGIYLDDGVKNFNAILLSYRRGGMNMRIASTFRLIPTYAGMDDIAEVDIEFKIDKITYFPLQITE